MGGGPPCFPPDYSCPVVLWIPASRLRFRLRDFYPLRFGFPTVFDYLQLRFRRSSTPVLRRVPVWPLSRSLAATKKIDLSFSSSGYLDVSVHRVPYVRLWIHLTSTVLSHRRVPPFGYPWLYARLQLPMAFRSLPRPSSALGAKASALCSF